MPMINPPVNAVRIAASMTTVAQSMDYFSSSSSTSGVALSLTLTAKLSALSRLSVSSVLPSADVAI